jgi:hypothetical protein
MWDDGACQPAGCQATTHAELLWLLACKQRYFHALFPHTLFKIQMLSSPDTRH